MKKLLTFYDNHGLKILVSFLILFIALYPKLPSVHIIRTWVYIRLEDFFILATVFLWFIQLFRRKVRIPFPIVSPFLLFWFAGFASLLFSIIFIGPTLYQFFPHIAALSFLRRVEYLILFFVAFTTVKSSRDIRDYFVVLLITILGVFLYGAGQRYYLYLWQAFPNFFTTYPFCFPSFQTGNEEFAKGIPLCLPHGARINATFGGHYDLAAYLVLVLPIMLGVLVSIKRKAMKIVTALLYIAGLILLLFTASRQSFAAYLVAVTFTLILYKKKWYILPVLALSFLLLVTFSGDTAKRLLSTVRISSVVTTSEGELVGETLPENLKGRVSKTTSSGDIVESAPSQELPAGSSFIGIPGGGEPVKTNVAVVKKTLTPDDAEKLQVAPGSTSLSTVTGNFLIQKALVYDISFTTRFQSEWPHAWEAFLRNPLLGSGYSTITLATDNDYLRALGETGVLGLFSFVFIFVMLGITMKALIPNVTSRLTRGFIFGVAGGVVGLAFNAILIDVFEASKVAESLWIILGLATGGLFLYQKKSLNYLAYLKRFFSSTSIIILTLFFVTIAVFVGSIGNFFVGDDFTWLRWAASGTSTQLGTYFTDAGNFFYRPLDKLITFFLYAVFSFQPQGYHLFIFFLHFLMVAGVYLFIYKILQKKLLAVLGALLFMLHPIHAENIYWFSGLSGVLCSVFILYATISFMQFREKHSLVYYFFALLLSTGAYLSYELAVVTPFLLLTSDFFFFKQKKRLSWLFWHIPSFIFLVGYFVVRHITNTFSGGGDYSYSLSHLVPNVVGNIFGYLGLFLAGYNFLPFYQNLRDVMRENQGLFAGILVLIFIGSVIVFYRFRKNAIIIVKNIDVKNIFFGFIFMVISLSPFLALGNIAERYLYLASVGLILSFILLSSLIISAIFVRRKELISWMLISYIALLGWLYYQEQLRLQADWTKAGDITRKTLSTFRIEYPSFRSTDHLYIINTPIKYKEAWVFPVGLKDGLWFIYRENTPEVSFANSIAAARAMSTANGTRSRHLILQFANNYNYSEVK